MVGDQPVQSRIGSMHVAQVPGTVERMKPTLMEFRRVADVTQPSRGLEQIGVVAEDRGQKPGFRSHPLDVGPATGQRDLKELTGEFFGPARTSGGHSGLRPESLGPIVAWRRAAGENSESTLSH